MNLHLPGLWRVLLVWCLCGASLAIARPAAANDDRMPGRIIVGLRVGYARSVDAIGARLAAQFGPAIQSSDVLADDLLTLRTDPANVDLLIAQLSAAPFVAYAEPEYRLHLARTPNDPLYSEQWALPQIAAPAAWEQSTGAAAVRIAVVDTGVDVRHPELAGRILPGRDFVNDDLDAADDNGHGTFVAGVIAAAGDDGIGVAGVCWSCEILPVKVMDAAGNGGSAALSQGIRWAVEQGAQVINISVGGPRNPVVLRDAIRYAESRGVLVVAAAGNEALDGNPVEYPAAYPSVLAVAATTASDRHAVFSNYGEQVDLAAPGVNITSTGWSAVAAAGYTARDGTSAATPFVSGVAALMLSVNPALRADHLRHLLSASADDLEPAGWDRYTGAGRINAERAVAAAWPKADDEAFRFVETDKIIKGEFRRFWEQNGGLPIFGLPVSDQQVEQTPEGRFLVQYFERNRFELHMEHPAGAQVLLGRLGEAGLVQRGIDWRATPASAPLPDCRFFAETGRNLCEPFLSYWLAHGLREPQQSAEQRSLSLFGLPLTEPRVETNAAGDTVLTQWFERARFEHHGEQGVLLGLLGSESYPPAKRPQLPPPPICPDVPDPVDQEPTVDRCVPVGTAIVSPATGLD